MKFETFKDMAENIGLNDEKPKKKTRGKRTDRHEKVRKLHAEGMSDGEIARRLGISQGYVCTIRGKDLRLKKHFDYKGKKPTVYQPKQVIG